MTGPAGAGGLTSVVSEVDVAETAAVAVDATSASQLTPLVNRPVLLLGLVLKAAGAAATIEAYNGEAASGTLAGGLSVAASAIDTEWLGPGGVYCPAGLSVALSGSPTKASVLVLYVGP